MPIHMPEQNDSERLELAKAIAALQTEDEALRFMKDILSERELNDLSQRYQVARLLCEGESYVEVSKKTGASSTTVSRVSKCLQKGAGGYRLILKRLFGYEL